MSIPLPFGSNAIQVFAYEGFDYTILNSVGSTLSNSSGLNPQSSYFTTDGSGNVRFAVLGSNTLVPSSFPESFTLTSNGLTSVNTVTINGGRFLDASGVTLSNNSYTFFRNEAIAPIQLVAPFSLNTPTSIPALPPGLSFVSNSPSNYQISGTPLVVVPNSNYQIIGVQQGGSKVVTTRFNMAISNDRLRMNLSGSPIIGGMQIGTPITPRVITSIPPVGSSTVRYTFPVFPDGIVVQDVSGNSYSNITSFTPTDPSYTMIIAGTPTSNAAYSFRNAGAGPSGLVYTVQGSRTVPLPIVENSQALTFAFGETVLFDLSSLPTFYTNLPIDSSANFFRAATYFAGTDVSITSMFSPDLRSDLSLIFNPTLARANLSGTPLTAGTGNFTIRATNANAVVRDYVTPLTIANDVVTFSSPVGVDLCYNFILSRPLIQDKTGYYPSNIQFVATAASGRPITLSAPALSGTGITLDSNGFLAGIPTAVTPLTNLVVTASTGTTSATKTVKFAVLNDAIILGDVSFSFIQNIPITPFQVPVQSTLSGRNVIDYSETGLPNGLSISPAGVVSGTCLDSDVSGTIVITATTGFASGSRSYSFTNEPDTILFTVPQDSYSYLAGQAIDPFRITGVAFSGTTVSNFVSGLPSSYGFLVSSTGLASGVWSNSIPPNPVLPSSSNFTITAQAGGVSGQLPVVLTASPIIEKTSFVWGTGGNLYKYNDVSWSYVSNVTPSGGAFDIQLRNSNVDANFILFTAYNRIWKATNTAVFTSNTLSNPTAYQFVSSLAPKTGTTTWWVSGTRRVGGIQTSVVLRSDDNNVTWKTFQVLEDSVTGLKMLSRDASGNTSNASLGDATNPYLNAGIALKYSSDAKVLMAGGLYNDVCGGPVMLRSSNDGFTWQGVAGEFAKECAYLSLDVSGMWIATGSDKYKTSTFNAGSWSGFGGGATNTIRYSTDAGSNWTVASGGFNVFGYELVYANNIWMATGVSATDFLGLYYTIGVKYSTDGSNWADVDVFNGSNPYGVISNIGANYLQVLAPLPVGSLQYDGSNWNILVQRQDASFNWVTEIRTAPTPTSTWSVTDVTSSFPEISNDGSRRFVSWTRPNFLRTSQSKQINIGLTFSTGIGNGPTITSPTTSAFLLYQYVPMSLVLDATGTDGTIYFFISADELPPGLRFNPLTKTISGKPASQGFYTTRVFAKDNNGVTLLTLNFTVNVPRVVRKQDGAGAYTSLLRQYTEVLGAQNARDSRVLPAQERRLGEFMSPEAPDVITQPFTTLKCGICGKAECPTILETIETGDAELRVCDVLDANGGDLTDLGDAEPDECD